MAFHSFSCIKFPCLIFDLKSHVFLTPTPSRTESFTPSVKTGQALALHTNATTQLPCPSLILLLSPRFWETRDQPIPGSFPKKDPGYEVGIVRATRLLFFMLSRVCSALCNPHFDQYVQVKVTFYLLYVLKTRNFFLNRKKVFLK